ncbi:MULTISPECIES: hypothetical protein [unclassified Streptomyces]|uniref:P-loop NTPase n=1 Tax=unclassified Streptomyces TaxID=2593676 RepID=UPI00344D609B
MDMKSGPGGTSPDARGFGTHASVQTNSATHGGTANAVQNGNLTVNQYFHADPGAPNPWLTPQEAFDDPQAAAYFSHHWDLVGRSDLVEQLLSFALGDDDTEGRIGVLVGAAGGGKSRVLQTLAAEFARRSEGVVQVLLATDGVHQHAVEQLPQHDRLLVIIEDAHQRPDELAVIIRALRRERPGAVLVVSTRPSGTTVLRGTFRQLRVDDARVSTWELGELSTRDASRLAEQALGEAKRHLARRLAATVGDSPFLLVFSAVEIARGRLDPQRMQSDARLHREVVEAFIETALTDPATRDQDRAVLHTVAALQPVRTDVPCFLKSMAALLGTPDSVLQVQLRRLVSSGVLARRGASHRILPDLLGDVLLAEAAINPDTGASTGFLERVLAETDGEPLTNALVNAGRVDWQWSRLRPTGRSPFEPLWHTIEQGYTDGDASTRSQLLKVIRNIAPFQPRRVLGLLRPEVETGPADAPRLLDDIPPVLAAVAQDPEHLGEALDLLWKLGQHDMRPLRSSSQSALGLLSDLASYSPDKPLLYQEAVVEAVARWAQQGPVRPADRMPFALLDRIFEPVAEGHEFDGRTLTISRLPLLAERVAPVRDRAYRVLLEAYGSADRMRAGVAARSFAEALSGQGGQFADWLVPALEALAARTREVQPGPLVALAVRRSVHWHVAYGSPDAAAAARVVLEALPDSLPHRLSVLLHSDCHEWSVGEDYDYEATDNIWSRRLAVASSQAAVWDDATAWDVLRDLLEQGMQMFAEAPPGCTALIAGMASERPTRAAAIIRGALECSDITADLVLPPALKALWKDEPDAAWQMAAELADASRAAPVRAVLRASAARLAAGDVLHPHELAIARQLATRADSAVGTDVLRLAVSMIRNAASREDAIALVCSVPFSGLARGAADFCWAFIGPAGLSWSEFTAEQRKRCLAELAKTRTIDDHRVKSAIAALSESHEDEALDLLLARLESWEQDPKPGFNPLPFAWHARSPFTNNPRRVELLRRLTQWFEEEREHPWRRELYGTKLFATVAGHVYDSAARDVLLEVFRSGEHQRIDAVAPLLSGAHRGLLWEEPQFVAEVLSAAVQLSEELYRKVGGRLMSSVTDGSKSTSPGEPYPQDLEILQRATEVRATLRAGSPEERLYAALQDYANTQIDSARREDLNFDARRTW